MKQTIVTLLLLLSIKVYSQSSTIGFIPATETVVLCTDNINLTTEYSPFGLYTMWEASQILNQSDYRYGIPNTLGVNVALFQNSVNLGGGGTILWGTGSDYEVIPNFLVRFHPLKMLTQNNRMTDVSLMMNISQEINFGIGLSFKYRLNAL
jgi:hypothetical protein